MRIGLISIGHPRDSLAGSGVPHHVLSALEREPDVTVAPVVGVPSGQRRVATMARWLGRATIGGDYLYVRTTHNAQRMARAASRALKDQPPDVVLSLSTLPVARLETDTPVVIWIDMSFASFIDYYDTYRHVAPLSVRHGHVREVEAFRRACVVVLTSHWAAETAISAYGLDRARLRVVPRGANLQSGLDRSEAERLAADRDTSKCELLLVGREWQRKGAPLAVEVLRLVRRAGIDARLRIVGCRPPRSFDLPSHVEVIDPIDKSSDGGLRRLAGLYASSHLLLMPSRAEAFGNVALEAAQFAVPTLATRTGGVPETVFEGVSGHLFHPGASPEEWAERVAQLHEDRETYLHLACSAHALCRERFTWDVVAPQLVAMLREAADA